MTTVASGTAVSKEQARADFLQVWESLREEILSDPMMVQKDAAAWMTRMLDHTVPGGKLNRGMAVRDVLVAVRPDAPDSDKLQADRLGWAIEFIQVRCLHAPCQARALAGGAGGTWHATCTHWYIILVKCC